MNAGAEVSIDDLRDYAKEWDELISSITDDSYNGRGQWVRDSVLGILGKEFPQIAKYSKEWNRYMNAGDNGISKYANGAADSVNRLAVALSTATKAKQAFDAAMEHDPENKGFSDYQSAYQAYAEEIEAGRVASERAMAAAQYLMAGTKYNFDELWASGGYKAINAAMKEGPFKTMYGDAEKAYGEGFLTLLSKIAKKNGEIVDSNGQVVASYKESKDGIQFYISDLMGLTKVTGLSVDQVWQAIQALSVYGQVDSGIKSFTDSLKELG